MNDSLSFQLNRKQQNNAAIDIVKLIMAVLVIGIHTEPFASNLWIDRGFGILTRLCVPFFFVSSAYFLWSSQKNMMHYLKRIIILYAVWSILYLPFDIDMLSKARISQILIKFFWLGNDHALWYLWGSIVGLLITLCLSSFLKPKIVLLISALTLCIGCFKSTWSPLFSLVFTFEIPDYLGTRNGLYYAFPYIALGMYMAKSNTNIDTPRNLKKITKLMFFSFVMLIAECVIFVIIFDTKATILWMSVLPLSYYFFQIVSAINIPISDKTSFMFRKISTLMYVSHYLFIYLYRTQFNSLLLFILVSASSFLFSVLIIQLSKFRLLKFLKYLY